MSAQKPFTLNQLSVHTQSHNINYLLTDSKVFLAKILDRDLAVLTER